MAQHAVIQELFDKPISKKLWVAPWQGVILFIEQELKSIS